MILYHFTCDHGYEQIVLDHEIRPMPQPMLGGEPLTWWTDDPGLPARALGLQSTIIDCDRTAHAFTLDTDDTRHIDVGAWTEFRRQLIPTYAQAISQLEFGRSPRHWWITTQPVPARLHLKNR